MEKTRSYPSDNQCNRINAYGLTKRAGEVAIAASGSQHVILRTSSVFSRHGSNFVGTRLRLGRERRRLLVVSDQFGGPTSAGSIAICCAEIAKHMVADRQCGRTYHFFAAPVVNRFEISEEIFRLLSSDVLVTLISKDGYSMKTTRPNFSVLDCQSSCGIFGFMRPECRTELLAVLRELGEVNANA